MLNEQQSLALLKRRIFLDRGFDCEQYKENYLKRRIAVRLRATGSANYLEYLRVLRNEPAEYKHLLDELTINVTQFFRDEDVYKRLRDSILPALLEAKAAMGARTIRIWSAGCASGEEPYSALILLHEKLGEDRDSWNIRVVGSDIDEDSLKAARRGEYSECEVLEGMDRSRYFELANGHNGETYRLRDEIRKGVKFEKLDLLREWERRHYDMILCRNVLIYFGRQVQSKIIRALHDNILHRGYLVLGKSETLGSEVSLLFKPVFPRERIYQVISDRKFGDAGVSGDSSE